MCDFITNIGKLGILAGLILYHVFIVLPLEHRD
jgi:hypothetical protein